MVSLLLDRKANVHATNAERATSLHRATAANHNAIVLMLLEGGADIEAETKVRWFYLVQC